MYSPTKTPIYSNAICRRVSYNKRHDFDPLTNLILQERTFSEVLGFIPHLSKYIQVKVTIYFWLDLQEFRKYTLQHEINGLLTSCNDLLMKHYWWNWKSNPLQPSRLTLFTSLCVTAICHGRDLFNLKQRVPRKTCKTLTGSIQYLTHKRKKGEKKTSWNFCILFICILRSKCVRQSII